MSTQQAPARPETDYAKVRAYNTIRVGDDVIAEAEVIRLRDDQFLSVQHYPASEELRIVVREYTDLDVRLIHDWHLTFARIHSVTATGLGFGGIVENPDGSLSRLGIMLSREEPV